MREKKAFPRPVMSEKESPSRPAKASKAVSQPHTGLMRPGQDLVVAGFAGFAGAAEIVRRKREELRLWFSETYLQRIARESSGIWNGRSHQWETLGITAGEQAGEGGLLTALWNLSGDYGVGIEFFLRLIPVKQSTIEICERYGLNPYGLYSEGCWLFAADHGSRLVRLLENEGSHGAVIGSVTRGNSRIVNHGESIGYLERPREDEIYKIFRR